MFKFKNIFLYLTISKKFFFTTIWSLFFFFYLATPEKVFSIISCIPSSDIIPSGCTMDLSQPTYCEGLYGELDSTPNCVYGFFSTPLGVDIKNYYCHCNITYFHYMCAGVGKVVYAVNGASLRTDNSCMQPGYVLPSWYSNITRQEGTDLNACRTACETGTPAVWCDASCGICGVRLNNGTCVNDFGNAIYHLGCCRMECTSCNSCGYVNHSGSDLCSIAGQCTVDCPTNTPTPIRPTPTATKILTPTPVKIIVYGYVKNTKTGLPVAGARILVQKTDDKYGFCSGQHWGCSPDYIITDSIGKWITSCINGPMKSIFVKEVNNATGYIDSTRYPDPAGATVWDKNTVCYQNIAGKTSVGPVIFYDQK